MFTLTFTDAAGRTESVPLEDGDAGLVVGRDAACDVVLQSKEVSRRHARFFVRAGDLNVEDLGSHNGVFVAGRRIERATPLSGQPLPEVELGDVRVVVGALEPGAGAGAVLRGKGRYGAMQIALPARAVVGRGGDCDVVLDDDSVSRRHAELFRDERGLYQVQDLGSANGTFLDGKRVAQAARIPDGAAMRFGDVELLFWRPPRAARGRSRMLLFALVTLCAVLVAEVFVRERRRAQQEEAQTAQGEDATALLEQAQAALEGDRFDEAARLAQQAIDQDPLAAPPRKLLAQARREQGATRLLADASGKAQVGREDEALRLYAQVDAGSRFFPRARLAARELAQRLTRKHTSACRSESARERWAAAADECGLALDVKCQSAEVDDDPLFELLRAAERHAGRKVPWVCPRELALLFRDAAPEGAAAGADRARALSARYPDPALREALALYARGEAAAALRALSAASLRGKEAALARDATEKIRLVDGRFREGQTALLRNELTRLDDLWGEAIEVDAALLPPGADSFLGNQMRATLGAAHGKAGDERFARGQYASAWDEWTRGLARNPRDAYLLDSLARLEKVADGILAGSPSCDEAGVALHITRADPPSPAHEAAQKALRSCR